MNIYVQQIKDICIDNKYTKWYCNIISKRLQDFSSKEEAKEVLGYCEGHHILPKGFKMGGVKDKQNIVYLTAREHFLVHMLLVKMVKDNLKYRLSSALTKMNLKNVVNSRTYETSRLLNSKNNISKLQDIKDKKYQTCLSNFGVKHAFQSDEIKNKFKNTMMELYGVDNPMRNEEIKNKAFQTNIKRTGYKYILIIPENREKMLQSLKCEDVINKRNATNNKLYGGISPFCSEKVRNKSKQTWNNNGYDNPYQSEKVKEKLKSIHIERFGFDHPMKNEEIKNKAKLTTKTNSLLNNGVSHPNKVIIKCPHCGKEGGTGGMLRWHFDKCKLK